MVLEILIYKRFWIQAETIIYIEPWDYLLLHFEVYLCMSIQGWETDWFSSLCDLYRLFNLRHPLIKTQIIWIFITIIFRKEFHRKMKTMTESKSIYTKLTITFVIIATCFYLVHQVQTDMVWFLVIHLKHIMLFRQSEI